MSTPQEVLLRTLEDLGEEEFKKFKQFLMWKEVLEDFPAIPKYVLENADRMKTVDEMFKTYSINTMKVTVMVLKKISRNDLVQNIPETMKEPAVTLQSESHSVEKLQKPAADGHQLKTTRRSDDDLMDKKDKKPTNRPGNRNPLKKTKFSVSNVQHQTEKLHMTTEKPEEDFMDTQSPTCSTTDQPFRGNSMEQLIRKLQKSAADEHQLTPTKRPADDLMDTIVKKSRVLKENEEYQKITLIINIRDRDLLSLSNRTILRGIQVYENNISDDDLMDMKEKHSVAVVTLVLLGMAGTGKSATGNTILGEQRFYSTSSSMPVTKKVQMESTNIDKTHVRLIDTPDLFDNIMKSDRNRHVARCKQLCGSGPLVYLLVMHVRTFTDEEREILEKLEKMFGRGAKDKTVILFTRGRDLENDKMSLQDFVHRCQPKLREIIQKCGNRCVLFENNSQSSQQVNELMRMVFRLLDHQRK